MATLIFLLVTFPSARSLPARLRANSQYISRGADMTPALMSLSSTLSVLTLLLLQSVSITQSGDATARSLAELTRSAKECGPGGWLVARSELEEFARKRSSKRYCYRTGRMRNGTWVDAFLECQRNGSELVWVTSAEEAAWLIAMLHSYSVDRSKDDWFDPQNGWMVNAHRYLYSERYGRARGGKAASSFDDLQI